MKENFPGCLFLHNYDTYKLIPIADWVVALGKTTSAVEALCWNKPLITSRGFDDKTDDLHEWNVSQPLEPFKKQSWKMLECHVPQAVLDGSSAFLDSYFYKRNTQAIEIAVDTAEQLIYNEYIDPWNPEFDKQFLDRIKD